MAPIQNAVFATLLMNDAYLPGAMVLGHSLRDRKAKGKLVCFVLTDKLSAATITELKTVYDDIVPVQQILNKTPANLYLMDRPDLISTFTKIELWRQTQYSRIVYIDADVVAIRAPNELLTMDTSFAAVPDIGWPDCFNSGLLVLNPNMADYYALLALAERGISFDGADQGLLNMHFSDWDRLSFTYNCTPSGNYQYVPAYRHFQSSIQLVHFIGKQKPWHQGRSSSKQSGVYGELLGRWWAVYDAHYRGQETVYYAGSWQSAPRKVQDYVVGEETIYLPGYQAPTQAGSSSTAQPGLPPPSIAIQPPSEPGGAPVTTTEQPFGDAPPVEEQIRREEITPVPTVEQRKWSAPHVEWEPARAPPPPNSKPEASNFPSTFYEMSASRELFKAPATYPDAPKGMWYEVPEKTAPPPKPKSIFPWESKAPKPTRVFAEPKPPSPPPEEEPEISSNPESSVTSSNGPSTTTEVTAETTSATESPQEPDLEPYVDPWTTFNQRTNAWDDIPEISRYMQAFNQPKKGKIQVLHNTIPSASSGMATPPNQKRRRSSLKITDFPTAVERPSLPVTPAPIRRPSFWGEDKADGEELPAADGVPKQTEWVRRFSSYPQPEFAALSPLVHEIDGVLCFRCQQCGQQNPVAKLDELEKRKSAVLLFQDASMVADPPKREMPDSASREAVVAATEKAMSPAKMPLKPILKEPRFSAFGNDETSLSQDQSSSQGQSSSHETSSGYQTSSSSFMTSSRHQSSSSYTISSEKEEGTTDLQQGFAAIATLEENLSPTSIPRAS